MGFSDDICVNVVNVVPSYVLYEYFGGPLALCKFNANSMPIISVELVSGELKLFNFAVRAKVLKH